MTKKNQYSYSIGLTEFARLNADKSFPTPNDWTDADSTTGEVRNHKGGIVGKSGTFNLNAWTEDDLTVGIRYGTKNANITLNISTAVNSKAVTVDELVSFFNTAFATVEDDSIKLTASATTVGADYDAEYLKITTSAGTTVPFFMPIGFSGRLAELLGITGWVSTKEAKSFRDDFEKEASTSVDATSGHGVRCSIKEPEKIKGINLTASFASMSNKLYAMITGHSYNEETGELYIDNEGDPPLVAVRYFVEQYEGDDNVKGSFSRVKSIIFPTCQFTPTGNEAGEGAFAVEELTGSGSANKRSNLPLKFVKEIGLADYTQYIGV